MKASVNVVSRVATAARNIKRIEVENQPLYRKFIALDFD